ncbi:hypothetical protein HKB01_05170 [Vibrio parahaemolyticus]|nr:hypothetical protein [Vibrio parahaemolyticus]
MFNEHVAQYLKDIMFDPQTSGGLLISVGEDDLNKLEIGLKERNVEYSIIGKVVNKEEFRIYVS